MIALTGQLQQLRRIAAQKCANAMVVFRLDPARGDSITLTGSSADPLLRSRETLSSLLLPRANGITCERSSLWNYFRNIRAFL